MVQIHVKTHVCALIVYAGSWTSCTFNGARCLYARLLMYAQLGQALWVCGVGQDFHWALSGKLAYKLSKACKLMLHMHI